MPTTKNDSARKTILLVEDEPLVTMTTRMKLEGEGFRVITAPTGEQAVEVCRSDEEINLILMDINLGPGIDGTQAAQTILNEQDIPLVFLYSHTDPETVAKTEKITSYGYIVKSAGDGVLLASVRMAFRLYEANARIRENEHQYTTPFDTIPHGVIHLASDGSIISVNPAAAKIFGLSLDQMPGQTMTDSAWPVIREDGSQVSEADNPAVIALRTGQIVGPIARGVFHPDRQRYV